MESFDFVKKLIEEKRYLDYKKDYDGGANVIIASPERLNKKDKSNPTLKDIILANHPNDRIIETKFASSVIWLIKTLSPYVDYDYLSKYEYYSQIADCVESFSGNNEKQLLLDILKELKNGNWEKSISRMQYSFKHNNPRQCYEYRGMGILSLWKPDKHHNSGWSEMHRSRNIFQLYRTG